MNISPQACLAQVQDGPRKVVCHPVTKAVLKTYNPPPCPEDNAESEENVLIALWQNWASAIRERSFAACVLFHGSAFASPECQIVVEALLLHDGNSEQAALYIERNPAWRLDSLRRLVSLCQKFPMSIAGAREHVSRVVERIARKGRAL